MIRLEKRPQPSRAFSLATPLLAVLATMFFGGLLFAALGKDPIASIVTIFWQPLFGEFAFYYRPQLLIKGAPLVLIAIGLSLGFKAGIWNIGAEGQYIMGALFGAGVGLAFYPMEGFFIFPLMVLAGALGGWIWAMIPAVLKVRFGTNEILVSLMLVYVAEQFLASMSLGLLKNPEGFGFPGSRNLQQYPSAFNSDLVAGSGMHWGVVAAFIAVIFAYVMLTKHRLGFAIRVTGEAPRAARFSGVNPTRLVLICLGISGALAGMAGLFESPAPQDKSASISTWATGSRRSSWRSWGVSTLSASCWLAGSWRSPTSAAKSRSPTLGYRVLRSNCSKGCCCSSCSQLMF